MNDRAAPFTAESATAAIIENAVGALGEGPLNEAHLQRHVAPLFSRALAARDRVDLANHSLGRPLDAVTGDVAERARARCGGLRRARGRGRGGAGGGGGERAGGEAGPPVSVGGSGALLG